MIHDRDYIYLSKDELKKVNLANEFIQSFGRLTNWSNHSKFHQMPPMAFYYNRTLFPNNYLLIDKLENRGSLKSVQDKFTSLINDKSVTERRLLNHINSDKNYNLIGSLFHSGYDFGHHEAFLFKEFELSSTYRVDYLLVGKSSNGYEFIFIELESPYGQVTNKDGDFGSVFRKGLKQVQDWDTWIEGNFHSLKLIFNKYKNPDISLPEEFLSFDKSRVHFMVVAGRRSDFNENTYRLKRKYLRNNNIKILHYDNVVDCFEKLSYTGNY